MPKEIEYQNINFRMDKNVKKELDEVLSEIGLNSSTTFNMIARLIIRERGIPFPITIKNDDVMIKETRQLLTEIRKEAKKNGTSDLSMEDIDNEIALYRKEKRESEGAVK
jgi:addiction module antitoxin, RelB/DinJ family